MRILDIKAKENEIIRTLKKKLTSWILEMINRDVSTL